MKYDECVVGIKVECRFDLQTLGPVWEPVGPQFREPIQWLPTTVLNHRKNGRRSFITISIGIMASSEDPKTKDITRDVFASWLRKKR